MFSLLLLLSFIVCSAGANERGLGVCWNTDCSAKLKLPLVQDLLSLEVCCKEGGLSWGITEGSCLNCPVSTTVPPTDVAPGKLSAWAEWEVCSATCGSDAHQARRRSCEPRGARCVGDSLDGRACLPKPPPCPASGSGGEWTGSWGEWTGSWGEWTGSWGEWTGSWGEWTGSWGGWTGSWGEWTVWSECDTTCRQQRSRKCNSPSPKYNGPQCSGKASDEQSCDRNPPCKVHGAWSDWTTWTNCEVSCGTGRRFRKRMCNSPTPQGSGRDCRGFADAVEPCALSPCQVDGEWSSWTESTSCSQSCGGGTKQMIRLCNNPKPHYGGRSCNGRPRQVMECNKLSCPVNGKWSSWGSWSVCSANCGSGIRERNRTCDDPSPKFDGSYCPGSDFSRDLCNEQPCPADGAWSEWSNWTPCSKSCEGGVQSRNRKCDNPSPDHGGRNCPGQDSDESQCNTHKCPVDGGWSSWSLWSHCTSQCDVGSRTRTRVCNSPRPAFNGSECDGKSADWRPCHKNCPVHGGWSDWAPWTQCTQSCEGGTRNRYRSCNSPPPHHDGRPCPGHFNQKSECNKQPCPVDGSWSQWSTWGSCSVSCGGGFSNRMRKCDDPSPMFGGIDCEGASTDKNECNQHPCPLDGAWGSWSSWSPCSALCGNHNRGKRFRSRQCNDPSPDFGGKFCHDRKAKEEESCNRHPCPIDGGWSSWESWTHCTKTCRRERDTPGTQYRNRLCNNPSPQFEGADCGGNAHAQRPCFDTPCPVHGMWGEWGSFGKCTKSCGIGVQERRRACFSPLNGGRPCSGFSIYKQKCCEVPCKELQLRSRQTTADTVGHEAQKCAVLRRVTKNQVFFKRVARHYQEEARSDD
ncbi:A disintegrin and metalloproteinase with thrombospondin motifs adt-1-like [Oscarella lobularis]|uniref:A disintegrin and metalloproteinase with thrombospondin motifs adt-1-like n=1 Tax=Oscarella lobularis TaxID=121494 RepID=UPI0033138466